MRVIERLERARRAYMLGRKLQAAMERGRRLHPWVDTWTEMDALHAEVYELRREVELGLRSRIRAEALDCAVVALRIMDGA